MVLDAVQEGFPKLVLAGLLAYILEGDPISGNWQLFRSILMYICHNIRLRATTLKQLSPSVELLHLGRVSSAGTLTLMNHNMIDPRYQAESTP